MSTQANNNNNAPRWSDLLREIVSKPGTLSTAFRAFHNFSLGNQLLAFCECKRRNIPIGPLATFKAWKSNGRSVISNAKQTSDHGFLPNDAGKSAITLCMPITVKHKAEKPGEDDSIFTRFIFKANWFVLAQTEGADMPEELTPGFDIKQACDALSIQWEDFDLMSGNVLGYASGNTVRVSPLAPDPTRTLLHEIAHVVLGHTKQGDMQDGATVERNLRELEAESVAYLISDSFALPGASESRGYIQHWFRDSEIPEVNARRILKAASAIMKAGKVETSAKLAEVAS